MKERSIYWDTLKGVLILLVLIGHFGGDNTRNNHFLDSIIIWIYLFHMPLFMFISGFFSKNLDKCEKKSFAGLFLIFILFQVLYGLWELVLHNNNYYLVNILSPAPALWYILAIFIMKKVLPDFLKLKHPMCVALVLYFLQLFMTGLNNSFIALNRVIAFFPFFLIGYFIDQNTINELLNNKFLKKMSIIILIVFFLIVYFVIGKLDIECIDIIDLLCHRIVATDFFGFSLLSILIHIGLVFIAIIMSISLIVLIKSNTILAYIGKNSLPIYLIHIFIQDIARFLQRKILIINNDYINFMFSLIIIGITLVLILNKYSLKIFNFCVEDKYKSFLLKEENIKKEN